MLKLPKCPYCGCSYSYGKINKIKNKNVNECTSCKKLMSVAYKKNALITAAVLFVVLIVLNTLLFKFTKNATVYPNLIITIIFIILFMCFIPFLVRFGKIDGQEQQEKLKKNRHRQKKMKDIKSTEDENPLKDTIFD